MKSDKFIFSGFFVVIVWGAAASPNLLAQTQSRLYLGDELKTIEERSVLEEDHGLSSLNGTHAIDIAECRAGQTLYPGEQCAYPGAGRAVSVSEDTTIVYGTGRNQDRVFLAGAAGNIMAQRYEVLPGARLTSVLVAPMYDNQFNNSTVPADAPRDFTLRIWNVDGDGLPGDELYSMDVDEATDATHVLSDHRYSFLTIDFSPDEEVLSALPDSIFIGLANKGTDENYLAMAISRRRSNAPAGIAYLYRTINSNTRWYPLARLEVGGLQLSDHVFPIRARFLANTDPVSTDDPAELPSGVKLAQNYPNPFNPVTSISWAQPGSAQVRLSVYNLLGQRMAMPADGLYPAGEHEVRLDASGWASGVYMYALETGTHMLTRRMVLLK